jgi:hypothetical protein
LGVFGEILEAGLQPRLDLFHDFGDERLLGTEVMEQHARAGIDRSSEGPERQVSDPVAEEVSEAFLEELVPGRDVTNVT